MCYYVQKVYNFEVLKMRCEFMKDENGHIWFFYASDIQVRSMRNHQTGTYAQKKAAMLNEEARSLLVGELERH